SADVDVLESLGERDRAAVYLSVVEGRSSEEVAAVIGGSAGAARTRVSRALRHLRAEMIAMEVSDGIVD
ncbi:MAG TPA: sigma factor-like helix-turn-helix DNA-binding protein, partial [Ilumatobacteraceae bacterium]